MAMQVRMVLLMLSVFICVTGLAQQGDSSSYNKLHFASGKFLGGRNKSIRSFGLDSIPGTVKDSFILIQRSSKLNDVVFLGILAVEAPVETTSRVNMAAGAKREPLLKITGNILYDVNYRSRIDTPYAEHDVYQHMLQTRLDMVYKNQYPFRVYLTTRFSNSSFFRDYSDFTMLFNAADFKRIAKQQLMDAAQRWLTSRAGNLDSLKRLIELKKMAIASLSQSLQQDDHVQAMVEEREKLLRSQTRHSFPNSPNSDADLSHAEKLDGKLARKDSFDDSLSLKANKELQKLGSDSSVYAKYAKSIRLQQNKLDTLKGELLQAEHLYQQLKSAKESNLGELKKQIAEASNAKVLTEKLKQLDIPDSVLPRGYKKLFSIQSLSIGRSIADYSELSVKNISITGVQAEYNPGYYYAFAVGKVDYRFRDYIIADHQRSSQYVALARFGKGTRNGNHIIFTYYTGKRQFFNSSIASQPSGSIPEYNLAGITIEGLYRVNKNISVVGEIAKSTMPYYSLDSLQRKGWMNSVARFNDRSNEAYAIKLLSFFPKTLTFISGNLRYTGANFQSFSTFTTAASQLMWVAKIEQPFFKKKLSVISSLQQNDYSNPFVTTAYKSSALLASLQANLRIKSWPSLSVGYYPSYQLIKTGNDQYTESRYFTLTGSAGYFYTLPHAQLSSFLLYSRFYNQASDSGFVYYNSKNILLSQIINFSRASAMVNISLSTGVDYHIQTAEGSGQLMVSKWLSAGAGVKMIRYSLMPSLQWGYSGTLSLRIPIVGEIQLMMDKAFIPGPARELVENNIGRLTYYKTF
jgi:hypothetical protein